MPSVAWRGATPAVSALDSLFWLITVRPQINICRKFAMNTEPWLTRTHTTLPADAVPDQFIELCKGGTQHGDNHIFIDVPDDAPDISPTEKVTVHISEYDSGEFAGRLSVRVTAVRHQDSIAAGIPTRTMVSAPAYYLTEAGVRSIRPNAEHTIYARWRLARPTRLAPDPQQAPSE